MSSSPYGVHLTPSRINHLLRPLRNKCLAFAAAAVASNATSCSTGPWPPPRSATVMYSTSHPNGRPPLDPTVPSRTISTRHMIKHASNDKVSAIVDVFRNIIRVAFGDDGEREQGRVPSLTSMCSMVVGENIPLEDTDLSSEDRYTDQAYQTELLQFTEELYDYIPSHLRRWTVASHALSMIFHICPPNHTLMNDLLAICLTSHLFAEAHILLRRLMIHSFSPNGITVKYPPITHSGYSIWITSLRKICVDRLVQVAEPQSSTFNTRSFTRTLADVLSQIAVSTHWACKAVRYFANEVKGIDYPSFILMVIGLWNSWVVISQRLSDEPENVDEVRYLRELMVTWFMAVMSFTVDKFSFPVHIDIDHSQAYDHILGLVSALHSSRTHMTRNASETSKADYPDSAIVMAVICLNSCEAAYTPMIAEFLKDLAPMTSTFDPLVRHLSSTTPSGRTRSFGPHFIPQLEIFSGTLQSHSLLRLDASLWACALRYFESNITIGRYWTSKDIEEYRNLLIEKVDEAEDRCFGGDRDSPPLRKIYGARDNHSEWEWEEMVGGWIQKSPPRKKRKIVHIESPTFLQRLTAGNSRRSAPSSHRSSSTMSSSSATSSRLLFSVSPSTQTSISESLQTPPKELEALEEEPGDVLPTFAPAARRVSNFSSLLADAQSKRTVLHPDRWVSKTTIRGSKSPVRPLRTEQEKAGLSQRTRRDSSDGDATLPSDDSMDLFCCRTSSPS